MADQTVYPPASAISFTATILLATYLHYRIVLPPVPITKTSTIDSFAKHTGNFTGLTCFAWFLTSLFLCQAVNALVFRTTFLPLICPNPDRPNPALLTWSPQSTTYLAAIIIFASFRLGAYNALGSSFTFTLTVPKDGLVTSGIYSYVQHPSYAAYYVSFVAMELFLWRVDGPASCWMEPTKELEWLNYLALVGFQALMLVVLSIRVREEERFLKREFGRKWEVWHQKTARIVPFVF